MLSKIYRVFCGCVIIEVLLELSELFSLRTTKNLDEYWRTSAMWEKNGFVIFTIVLVVMMWYLKPTEETYQLEEEMEELLNETL